jgi:hypothetical protein
MFFLNPRALMGAPFTETEAANFSILVLYPNCPSNLNLPSSVETILKKKETEIRSWNSCIPILFTHFNLKLNVFDARLFYKIVT